ncbi:hypothetical protein Cgig2_030938 [Carnegiea gigantea]|uniref:Uncharacterized protein n=1 Tax=Carnegiea gigantea TaxID=171969 RepID=A0A9Q1GK59_9CARY|nr:hypothetical protein Cgig2_030938 [Carnegiea gigantea]
MRQKNEQREKLGTRNERFSLMMCECNLYKKTHKKYTRTKRGVTRRALHYPHDLPSQKPWPQHPGGWWPHPLRPRPHPHRKEGQTPHPQGHGLHLQPNDAHPRSGGKPQNSCPPETLGPASLRPCVDTRGYQRSPTVALEVLLFGFTGDQIGLQLFLTPLVPSNKPLQSSTFRRGSHPPGECLGHCYFFLGSEAPGVIKSLDLTRSWTSENLIAKSALMKLVDGCWVTRGEPPAAWEAAPTGRFVPESRGCDPRMTGSPTAEGQTVQLPLPLPEKGQMPRSCPDGPQSAAACGSALPLLFSLVLGVGCHLLWSGTPGLKNHQPCPRLLCIKREVRSAPNIKMISIGTTNTLGIILKDQKAEIVCKKLQLKEPIQRLPITGLALSPLGALHRLNCLSHKLGDEPRLTILPYVKLEVTGRLSLFSRGLPKWVPHRFSLIPVRNVSPT